MRFHRRPNLVSLGAFSILAVLSLGGCAFKVDMPMQEYDDVGGNRGEDAGIDQSIPDVADDLGPDATGPACKSDADCEKAAPGGAAPQCFLWGCDKKAGQCTWIAMTDGTACTSGDDPCVLSWKCMGGECLKHNVNNCDDKNPCTTDWCSPEKGCQHGKSDGSSCNDGKQCTTGDTCQDGTCVGKEDCPTQELCEVGMCNEQGFCVYYPTPGRPGCGECFGWGLPGPFGEMIECCQDGGYFLSPRKYCGEGEFGCSNPEDIECQNMCEDVCATNQQVCVPCGNGQCDAFENFCNCPEDCGQTQTGCEGDWMCPDGMSCVAGLCQPGVCSPEEICNDDQDNDCDGQTDEPDCVGGQACAPPPGYFQTSIADLVAVNPSAKPGSKVAFKGTPMTDAKIQEPCDGPCCPVTKFIYKATDGGAKFVVLKGVGCKADACTEVPQCEPPEGMYYQFWGMYQKEQVEGFGPTAVPVLYVDGWCLS